VAILTAKESLCLGCMALETEHKKATIIGVLHPPHAYTLPRTASFIIPKNVEEGH
jgi:hypothetical protein